MFGLFKSTPFADPQLGKLVHERGLWRGALAVGGASAIPLAISGTRSAPDAQALAMAHEVAQSYASWRPAIEQALFEHYEPYGENAADADVPRLAAPADVWDHVTLTHVSVTPLSGVLTTELGYTTAWDEEHTLGARFQSGRLVELCGSV